MGCIYQSRPLGGERAAGGNWSLGSGMRRPPRPAQHHLTSSSLRPQALLKSRRTALQELCTQEGFLIKLNQDLITTIKDMEDSSALKTRGMLQQQDVFGVRLHLGAAAPPLPSAPLSRPPCRPPERFGALSWSPGRLHSCCWKIHLLHTWPHLPGLWNQTWIGGLILTSILIS